MGEPVRIVNLAEELIKLSGFRPYEDIEIKFIGLRPGEKLFEELLIDGEGIQPTSHEKIMVVRATEVDREHLLVQLEELYQLQQAIDQNGVIAKLREIVPEFMPENAGVERDEISGSRGDSSPFGLNQGAEGIKNKSSRSNHGK